MSNSTNSTNSGNSTSPNNESDSRLVEKKLIINVNPSETRVALTEDGRLAEIFIDRSSAHSIVGNIYKATVTRVLPGMNSAFLDIGCAKSGFLFGGDIIDPQQKKSRESNLTNSDQLDFPKQTFSSVPVEKSIKEGQQLIVQVSKDPLGTKGPRVTANLTIPGRFLVLMPYVSHVGVSRRIEDTIERERLRALVEEFLPRDIGVIIRTAAKGVRKQDLENDINFLTKTWRDISSKITGARSPSLLHSDLGTVSKCTRDLYDNQVTSIIVDQKATYSSLGIFLEATMPSALAKLTLYQEKKPIFDEYGVEFDIAKALGDRVDLPSGGHLIIEQTEALTSFDVNTGKFVGRANAQDTILKTNLEAATVICDQLRIRNLGGIIVLDFIDMESLEHREKIYNNLTARLRYDRARTNVLKISELGLVQMTRKRTSESLERQLTVSCPHCDGTGTIRSVRTEAYDLLREILRISLQTKKKNISVRTRSDIMDWLTKHEKNLLHELKHEKKIEVEFIPANLDIALLREPAYEVFASKP